MWLTRTFPALLPCVLQEAESLVSAVLPPDKQAAAPEIALYLKESVGNATRIDYGTGTARLALLWLVLSALQEPAFLGGLPVF